MLAPGPVRLSRPPRQLLALGRLRICFCETLQWFGVFDIYRIAKCTNHFLCATCRGLMHTWREGAFAHLGGAFAHLRGAFSHLAGRCGGDASGGLGPIHRFYILTRYICIADLCVLDRRATSRSLRIGNFYHA